MTDSALKDAEDLIGEIYEIIDENKFPERAEKFVESVQEMAEGIDTTMNETRNVTDRQLEALENMRNGLLEWLTAKTQSKHY